MTSQSVTAITIAYLLMGLFLLFLGQRGYKRYKSLKSPVSLYLALFGLFESGFFFFNSIPFFLTTDLNILKLSLTLGNIGYYLAYLVTLRLIWHITLKRRFPFLVLFIPLGIGAVVSFLGFMNSLYSSTTVKIASGTLEYNISPYVLYIDAFLALAYIIIAASLLREFKSTSTESGGRFRLLSFSGIYFLGGIIAIYNDLFLHSFNGSNIIVALYGIATLCFLVFVFAGRGKKQT